jgi:hypothetical protein
VESITDNVSVRIDIVLGTNNAPDLVTIKIYSQGVDPSISSPQYIISDYDSSSGSNLMIHP